MYFVAKLRGCANLAKRAPIHDEFISRVPGKEALVIEGNQHIALASASGKRVHFGAMCINRLMGQAVAVRIHSTSLIAVCCLYLPPNTVVHQHDLNNLVDQLPAHFVILGDFNGHSTLWGSAKTNHRGRQIEQGKTFTPRYSYSRADWALFTQLAVISDAMVKTESVDTAVQDVINVLIDAADLSIPKSSSHSFQRYKPWWNADCQTAYKNQRKLWGIFRRYPTTENLLAFKKAKANAR
ncbi:putative RNA-directed DNA polymerase from transposon X-element [Trichonephila clavipes]|nr:putative RNA-directed DNA polymerase from transposon X-element [Trichonephila clavipes]